MKECADQILILSLPVSRVDPCSFLCVVVYKVKLVVVISAEVPAGWQRDLCLLAARFWHNCAIQRLATLQSPLLTQRPHYQLNTSVRRPPCLWRPRPGTAVDVMAEMKISPRSASALTVALHSPSYKPSHHHTPLSPLSQTNIHFSHLSFLSQK